MPNKEKPPTPFSLETARAIKARIDHLGVSNAAVARRTGISANYLNERLREEKSFTLSDIERLATYFGVRPADLMRSVRPADVGADSDTSALEDAPILTAEELAQRDLDLAALRGRTTADQEAPDDDDARPGA